MSLKTFLCIIGTRPEAIKMAPVVHALRAAPWARCIVVATAQHRDLLDQMLDRLKVKVDHDLDLMTKGQQPSELIARMLTALDSVVHAETPDAILAQGDTATVFGAALCAFHHRIPFGHVEAGLRTHNLEQPFPEEGYRQMISRITRWHFAPTENAATALRQEGIDKSRIFVVGNTCIDTLLKTVEDNPTDSKYHERLILLTAHRRENFGQPLRNVFSAILQILQAYPDVRVLYPVHPNPNVHQLAHAILGKNSRIELVEPLDYFEFVAAMQAAYLIVTDSGGVQEEAPALGKPVLVLRNTTERPEPVAEGVARLVGTNTNVIVKQIQQLLDDSAHYSDMARVYMPYGDGTAAQSLVRVLRDHDQKKSLQDDCR